MYQDRQYKLFPGNTPFALGIIFAFIVFEKKREAGQCSSAEKREVVNGNVLFSSCLNFWVVLHH